MFRVLARTDSVRQFCKYQQNLSASSYLEFSDLSIFTTLWTKSEDNKLVIFFLFFPENRIWHFMQIVSIAWNIKFYFLEKLRKYFKMSSAESFTQSAKR